MTIRYFNRYELKYLLPRTRAEEIATALADYMTPDLNSDNQGNYTNTSIYYDTADYKAYRDKVEGHRFRRKVRIRVYNDTPITSDSLCFVEIKQRLNKTVQKKRVQLPYKEAVALCGRGQLVNDKDDKNTVDVDKQQIMQEIQYLATALKLQASCLVTYKRLAFNGGDYDPGLRVTFDTSLKARMHHLSLLAQDYVENHFFLPPHLSVMEIKVNNRVPYWLTEFIGRYNCTLRRVSKYCLALEQVKAWRQNGHIVLGVTQMESKAI